MINKFFNNTLLVLAFILVLILLSIPFQKNIDLKRSKFRSIEQTLYLSSSTLKNISLGYKGLLADIYWFRALQYVGSNDIKNSQKDSLLLFKYFNIITDLDPRFVNAYRYGGTFLAEPPPYGLNDLERGIELLDKGRRNNPANYRIPLEEAFLLYLYTNNFAKASDLFFEASEKSGLSDFRKASIRGMAASARLSGGDRKLSRKIWENIYNTTENPGRKKFALQNLNELSTKDLEDKLTEVARKYEEKIGIFPRKLNTLLDAGYLKKIPRDHADRNFIISQSNRTIKSVTLVERFFNENLGFINSRSERFKSEFKRYSINIEELKNYINTTSLSRGFPEHPLGEEYIYNPETGEVTYDEWW